MKRENNESVQDIDDWLAGCRAFVTKNDLDLLSLFDLYAAEARFGYAFIKNDLDCLTKGSSILEVGAGSMLLSCFLHQFGYEVKALDPVGIGFSHFNRLRDLILNHAQHKNALPAILAISAENLQDDTLFDFAFSINVMEHVTDVAIVLKRISLVLCEGGHYHYTCPNYLFPYEPHFNIPTFFSKKLTELVLSRKIFSNITHQDPVGLWESLNWINVPQLSKILRDIPSVQFHFDQTLMVTLLERVLVDRSFAVRRSPLLCKFISLFVKSGLHRMVNYFPPFTLPVIDCTMVRLPRAVDS